MKQHDDNLDTALNNNIPEHNVDFWANLETQLSKHTPVVSESSIPPLLEIVDDESPTPKKRYGRSGIVFLAAAACSVAALGFTVSVLPKTTADIEVASAPPIDYTRMQLEADSDRQPAPDRPTPSGDELQSFSVDASQLGISNTEGSIAPDAISPDRQHAIYVIGGAIVYLPINDTPDPDLAVVFDSGRFNDNVSRSHVMTEKASFSPGGSIVAIPHLEGIIIWNYQANESFFYSICPGFACSYITSDRPGDEVWFDETGSQLHFEVVSSDGVRTPLRLTFSPAAAESDSPTYDGDDNEIPNVFDSDE